MCDSQSFYPQTLPHDRPQSQPAHLAAPAEPESEVAVPVQVSAPGPRARVPRAWAAEVPLAELALAVRAAVRLVELVPAVLGQVVALPAPVWARAALEPGPPVCLFSRTLALLCTTARGAVRRPYPSALIISRCKVSLHVRKLHASLRMLWWGKGCVSSQQSWKSCTNVVEAATDTHTHTHIQAGAVVLRVQAPLAAPLAEARVHSREEAGPAAAASLHCPPLPRRRSRNRQARAPSPECASRTPPSSAIPFCLAPFLACAYNALVGFSPLLPQRRTSCVVLTPTICLSMVQNKPETPHCREYVSQLCCIHRLCLTLAHLVPCDPQNRLRRKTT